MKDWRSYMLRQPRDPIAFNLIKDDKIFLAWLAGFTDGEGTFSLQYVPKSGLILMFILGNTAIETVNEIHKKLGLGKVYFVVPRKPKHKPFARYQINRQEELKIFLNVIIPYLRVKKPEAIRMLNLIEKWQLSASDEERIKLRNEFGL